ncbi:hypothetical protein [Streptomyces sp. 3213.3]|uniref:hypothetical protein n=1 Tax=Streptomyces sp. 3213.3 TaxID=1855348 RepID=UPI000B86130B|nr:hypothetical protein [Streptomyces sp. 3213.3]
MDPEAGLANEEAILEGLPRQDTDASVPSGRRLRDVYGDWNELRPQVTHTAEPRRLPSDIGSTLAAASEPMVDDERIPSSWAVLMASTQVATSRTDTLE